MGPPSSSPYRAAGANVSRCLMCGSLGAPGTSCPACFVPRPPFEDAPITRPCPRCGVALVAVVVEQGATVHACHSCRWTFLPSRAWTRVFDVPSIVTEIEKRVPLPTIRVEDLLPIMTCPSCGGELERARFAATSRIVIDACRWGHGVWIDAGEIRRILEYAVYKERIGAEAALRESEDAWARKQREREEEQERLAAQAAANEGAAVRVVRTGPSLAMITIAFVVGVFLILAGLRLMGTSFNGKKLFRDKGSAAETAPTTTAPAPHANGHGH